MFRHIPLFQEALSLLLDFTPVLGSGKSAIECINGKDLITGEHINRWVAAGGIILGFIPFGKFFTRGKKSADIAEEIAAKIAYNAKSKNDLISKMEKLVPTLEKEVDHSFIMQEIRKIDRDSLPLDLKTRYGIHYDRLGHHSDVNLVHQYLLQIKQGGHAVHKHWISGGKRDLLEHLTKKEQQQVTSALDDTDEAFEYLKLVLKDPKTERIQLNRQRIGFANEEKKVLIIHNPGYEGTFYYQNGPMQALEKIYREEQTK